MKMNIFIKIERNILKILSKIYFGLNKTSKSSNYIDGELLNKYIYNSIISNKPFMVARYGSCELDAFVYPYLLRKSIFTRYKNYIKRKITFLRRNEDYANFLLDPLCNNAGFFPHKIDLLENFCNTMIEATNQLDCCCCCWINEDVLEDEYNKGTLFARLEEMEPYDYNQPWSYALKGKKVLIVHPFAETIKKQYAKRELIWRDDKVLPDFELITIKAIQTIAGEKTEFATWFDALDHMKKQINNVDFDVAIIGCGAYGFPLAAHCKSIGKQAIHLGGATQILFGIKGKRWDELPAVNKFYNDAWVYPSSNETPKKCSSVEGGCYW
jgi:hypothetical protein